MNKLIAMLVAAIFAGVSLNAGAAAEEKKDADAKKTEAKKDEKKKNEKKKEEMKKEEMKK